MTPCSSLLLHTSESGELLRYHLKHLDLTMQRQSTLAVQLPTGQSVALSGHASLRSFPTHRRCSAPCPYSSSLAVYTLEEWIFPYLIL